MRRYELAGRVYQFADGMVPEGAKPVEDKATKPAQTKQAAKPANKARKASAK